MKMGRGLPQFSRGGGGGGSVGSPPRLILSLLRVVLRHSETVFRS